MNHLTINASDIVSDEFKPPISRPLGTMSSCLRVLILRYRLDVFFVMLGLLCVVAGCAAPSIPAVTYHQQTACVHVLPKETPYCLQLPGNKYRQAVTVQQQTKIVWHGESFNALTVLEIQTDRLAMVVLTPLGQTLFSAVQDSQGVHISQIAGGSQPLDPAIFLMLVQFALWPPELIHQGFNQGLMEVENHSSKARSKSLNCWDMKQLSTIAESTLHTASLQTVRHLYCGQEQVLTIRQLSSPSKLEGDLHSYRLEWPRQDLLLEVHAL